MSIITDETIPVDASGTTIMDEEYEDEDCEDEEYGEVGAEESTEPTSIGSVSTHLHFFDS